MGLGLRILGASHPEDLRHSDAIPVHCLYNVRAQHLGVREQHAMRGGEDALARAGIPHRQAESVAVSLNGGKLRVTACELLNP